MIVANATIRLKTTSGGGQDAHGNPVAVTTEWSEDIACNVRYSQSDQRGAYVDGHFKRVAAVILIEPRDLDGVSRIQLTDNLGRSRGEHEIQDVQYLEAADALQITI